MGNGTKLPREKKKEKRNSWKNCAWGSIVEPQALPPWERGPAPGWFAAARLVYHAYITTSFAFTNSHMSLRPLSCTRRIGAQSRVERIQLVPASRVLVWRVEIAEVRVADTAEGVVLQNHAVMGGVKKVADRLRAHQEDQGHRFFIHFTDDHGRYSQTYPLIRKSDAPQAL